jgi:adenine deaminase
MDKLNSPAPENVRDSKLLTQVALGQKKADLAIVNTTLLNVYTGELLKQYSVSIKDKWIAYVGEAPNDTIGPHTTVIDAKGKTLIPGLIDGHMHLGGLFLISEFLKVAMIGGTTTIITETMEPFPVAGQKGVKDFLNSLKDQPVKIFATAPAMVSISRTARGISKETLREFLALEEIVGLGESYWQAVLQEPGQMLPIFQETLLSRKTLEGHSAGASGKKLNAYIATGISSCHEPISAPEVLERVRLGLRVMVREGSIRRDLEAISEIKDTNIDFRRLILVTDGIEPGDLMAKGYMEYVVQKAIEYGFDPIRAIQMATLNVAEHFSLDGLIGGIAPGRYADMLVIPDPENIKAEFVISNGQIISRQGKLIKAPRQHKFSQGSRNTVNLSRRLEPSDFSIRVMKEGQRIGVRVIDMVTDLVSKQLNTWVPVKNGEVKIDTKRDVVKVAAIDRTQTPGKIFVGLVKGFRMKSGAIASSTAWDTSDIIVVGANEMDMALAVNRIFNMQGGVVVCAEKKIMAEIPLPVFGHISELPMEMLVERIAVVKKAVSDLGVPFADPILTLSTLTGASVPFFRICEEGLVNLKDGVTKSLFLD